MSKQKKAIAMSYANMLIGMAVNLYLTPLMIVSLGDIDYSIYKVMHSLAGPLTMFHLGVSTVVTRSIIRNRGNADNGIREKQNTLALAFMASAVMSVFVVIAGIVMYSAIPSVYSQSYSDDLLKLGQKLFVIFVAASVFHMLTDAFSGCILGYERYIVSSAIPLAKSIAKFVLQIILLKCGFGVLFVVAVDLVIAVGVFMFTVLYAVFGLHEIPKLHYFDKKQLLDIITFGAAILMQAFVNQVNNNMDTMILGAFVDDKAIITMYSSALTVYAIYNSLISVVTHYFLPEAAKLTVQNASGKEMTDFIIRPGRFQAIIAVACICGFALFGRNFITVWIGTRYIDAYWIILILMMPVTVPLVQNAVISILDATMKRMYRSVVLLVMAVINLVVSVILVQYIGFWGAAIGTAGSLLLGHGMLMNLYYAKVYNIEIFRMFRQIFAGILPAGLLAMLSCLPIALFLPDTVLWFILKCGIFILIYAVLLWILGLNINEKAVFSRIFRKLQHK